MYLVYSRGIDAVIYSENAVPAIQGSIVQTVQSSSKVMKKFLAYVLSQDFGIHHRDFAQIYM